MSLGTDPFHPITLTLKEFRKSFFPQGFWQLSEDIKTRDTSHIILRFPVFWAVPLFQAGAYAGVALRDF